MPRSLSRHNIDFYSADRFSAIGEVPVIVADLASWKAPSVAAQAVFIGVDWEGLVPPVDPAMFDVLLTCAPAAPAPWVVMPSRKLEEHTTALGSAVETWPVAATILCRVLRLSEGVPFSMAVDIESFAYSTVLGGAEFRKWRQQRDREPIPQSDKDLVLVERDSDVVTLWLNHPEVQNAMTAAMRDALHAALANVLDDPSSPNVVLKAVGRCFSTGGALGEFGTSNDLAQAHVIRTLRNCAGLLHRLGERSTVLLHGACVGSGLEVGAAAAHRSATADTWFQLPELRMGLIPGAGGTASMPRAIGRHRTAWMVLSGKRIGVRQALAWGLVHEIVE
jgi:hypothetical protein